MWPSSFYNFSPLNRRASLLFFEQATNSGWNFVLSALVARWGGLSLFGIFAVITTIYFVLTSAISAMTSGIISVDLARLSRARSIYLNHASRSAELLAIPAIAIGVVAIVFITKTVSSRPETTLALFGSIYLAANIMSDISRRVLGLSDNVGSLLTLSFFRFSALCAWAIGTFIFARSYLLESLVIGTLLISVLYTLGLRICRPSARSFRRRISNITLVRQVRLGGWLFASSLATSALEQGLTIFSGMRGSPEIAGGLRSGGYLFGFLTPLIQIADLLLPGVAQRLLGRTPKTSDIALFVVCGGLIGAGVSALIGVFNAAIWLPFLGKDYVQFGYVSFWYSIMMSCFLARTCLMPFLKARAPKSIFAASLAGIFLGFYFVFSAPTFTLLGVCHAIAASAGLSLCLNVLTLAVVAPRPKDSVLNGLIRGLNLSSNNAAPQQRKNVISRMPADCPIIHKMQVYFLNPKPHGNFRRRN